MGEREPTQASGVCLLTFDQCVVKAIILVLLVFPGSQKLSFQTPIEIGKVWDRGHHLTRSNWSAGNNGEKAPIMEILRQDRSHK